MRNFIWNTQCFVNSGKIPLMKMRMQKLADENVSRFGTIFQRSDEKYRKKEQIKTDILFYIKAAIL